jgi:hypothetical protein
VPYKIRVIKLPSPTMSGPAMELDISALESALQTAESRLDDAEGSGWTLVGVMGSAADGWLGFIVHKP